MKNYTEQELWAMTKVTPNQAKNALKKTSAFDAFIANYNRMHPYIDIGIDKDRGDYRIEIGVAGTF